MIAVLVEHKNGLISDQTFELCYAAREISSKLDMTYTGIVLSGNNGPVESIKNYFPVLISVLDHDIASFSREGYSSAISQIFDEYNIQLLLLSHGSDSADLAGMLACNTSYSLINGCTGIEVENGSLSFIRTIMNGKIHEKRKSMSGKVIAMIRRGSFQKALPVKNEKVELFKASFAKTSLAVLEVSVTGRSGTDLSKEKIIVSGGRALRNRENFERLIISLSEKLGGEYAGSRPTVDSGWVDSSRQIGQSGITVSPQIYIAAGISGSIHHIAGMKGSKYIAAVNKDPDAPIFSYATWGIAGDIFEIIPEMLKLLTVS